MKTLVAQQQVVVCTVYINKLVRDLAHSLNKSFLASSKTKQSIALANGLNGIYAS
jgi:predicted PilT family ATPase